MLLRISTQTKHTSNVTTLPEKGALSAFRHFYIQNSDNSANTSARTTCRAMLLRVCFALVLFASFTLSARAAAYSTRIPVISGEKWWGAFVGNAPREPFDAPFEITTNSDNGHTAYVPILVSSEGRYIWNATPMTIKFDGSAFTISAASGPIIAERGGRTLRDAYLVCRHRNFPPKECNVASALFSQPIYETDLEFGYLQTADQITDYAAKLLREGFPAGIMVLSDGWQSADGSMEFDSRFYPDPKEFISKMHSMGFKVMLTVTPYHGASGRAYMQDLRSGNLLTDDAGRPVYVRTTNGFFTVSNVTRPLKAAAIGQSLSTLRTQYGVDGFRFDCSAVLRTVGFGTQTARAFAAAWQSIGRNYQLAEFVTGTSAATELFSPSRIASSGQNSCSYINDMIAAGLTGISAAYTEDDDIDLDEASENDKLRTLQKSLMMPTAHIAFAPWRVTDRALYAEVKRNITLRRTIGNHLALIAADCAKTAEPVARNMEYAYPKSGFADCTSQYMLGTKYLVAAVTNSSGKQMVRLPRGIWRDTDGNMFRGPLVISANTSGGKLLCYELL